MFLRMAYTDSSGAPHPDAIIEIVGCHVELTRDTAATDVEVAIFHDLSSHDNGFPPFEQRPRSALTPDEILALEDQFRAALYATLQQRAEFSGSTLVP